MNRLNFRITRILTIAITLFIPLTMIIFSGTVLATSSDESKENDGDSGTVITVSISTDGFEADGQCSLREAVQAANSDLPVDSCPAGNGWDTIEVPTGTYQLTLSGAGEDSNETGDLDILESVTIMGDISGTVTIDGMQSDRIFHVDPADSGVTFDLQNVTVINGSSDNGGGLKAENGAALIRNSTFSQNQVISNGGAIYINRGLLEIYTSTISNNTIITTSLTDDIVSEGYGGHGGGIYGHSAIIQISGSNISNNRGVNGVGLSLHSGSATIYATKILSNSGLQYDDTRNDAYGGGIYINEGVLEIGQSSQIAYNRLGNSSITGSGPGSSDRVRGYGG
ncbi:MAG: hypothetical protein AAGD96_21245, partial [Chloroflexota bacterium]